jgi:hypothetical protein
MKKDKKSQQIPGGVSMKTYGAGEPVKAGTYINTGTGQFISFEGPEKAILPAGQPAKYVKIPIGLVFILGPLMGLAYIIFLPLAGIGSLAVLAIHKTRGATLSLTPKQAKQ